MNLMDKYRAKLNERQRGQVVNHDLIERTLREIGKEYKPGLLAWIREDPNRWRRLLDLEDQINRAALSRDQGTLTGTLGEYRAFFREMIQENKGKGHILNLFEGVK